MDIAPRLFPKVGNSRSDDFQALEVCDRTRIGAIRAMDRGEQPFIRGILNLLTRLQRARMPLVAAISSAQQGDGREGCSRFPDRENMSADGFSRRSKTGRRVPHAECEVLLFAVPQGAGQRVAVYPMSYPFHAIANFRLRYAFTAVCGPISEERSCIPWNERRSARPQKDFPIHVDSGV